MEVKLDNYLDKIRDLVPAEHIKENEPLKAHSTMKIGGVAKVFVTVTTKDELCSLIKFCRENGVKHLIIGNASNILFADAGFDGVVISTDTKEGEIGAVTIEKCEAGVAKCCGQETGEADDAKCCGEEAGNGYDYVVTAGAGVRLSTLVTKVASNALTGLEFAGGIPGTVGGAVVMNAGAYGGEIKDTILYADVIDENSEIKRLNAEELKMRYRGSVVKDKGYIVLSATFGLKVGNEEEIKAYIKELNGKRRDKQPLEYPSLGSTFKRPENGFAAKMIEDAGLKGRRVGDMMISEKHAGFMINAGDGTAEDALKLISIVQEEVKAQTGVLLEPEVIYVE